MARLATIETEPGAHTTALSPAGDWLCAFLPRSHRAAIFEIEESAMADVVLHGFHRSTYVSIAKLVLTAKGVPFLFHDTEQAMGTANGWTLHPFDRVPVLTHDGFTVFETAAIAAYVDEAFFGPALSPAGPRERARMNQWISSVNSYYYPWIVYHLVHERVVFRELGIAADEAVVSASLPHIDRGLEVLEKVLGSGTAFLAGDRVSLADYFMLPLAGGARHGRRGPSRLVAGASGPRLDRAHGRAARSGLRRRRHAAAPADRACAALGDPAPAGGEGDMTDPGLLVLSRADIARLMDFDDYVDAVEAAFVAAAKGDAVAPPAAALHVPGGSFHAKAAALLGEGAVTAIKINGNFPGNPAANGLPTVQGVIYLADATNGRPLALMDSIEITINRTGAATTLAARHLARRDSRVATICGAGVQGRIQLIAIAAAAHARARSMSGIPGPMRPSVWRARCRRR